MRLMWGWYEINHIKCQVHSKYSVNITYYYISLIWHTIVLDAVGFLTWFLASMWQNRLFCLACQCSFFFLIEFISLPPPSPQKPNNRKTYLIFICTLTCLKWFWLVYKTKFLLGDEVFKFFLSLLSKNEYYVTQCGFLCLNGVQPLGKCLYAAKMNSLQGILLALCVIYKRYFKE